MTLRPTVLITGVAGFIGSNLADKLLAEGYTVLGIDNLSYGVRAQVPPGVVFHELDVRDEAIYPVFAGVDAVFHLAAKNSLLDCQKDPVGTMDHNVVGTANVFEAARRAGVRKVIYAQSSVLEEGDDRLRGFYAISKMAGEWIAEGYMSAFGTGAVGLRYFNVYGPRQDYRRTSPPIMSKLLIDLLTGRAPVLFEGDEKNARDFIHVDDVNAFHLLCLTDDRTNNKVFRIGSGVSYSIESVLEIVQKVLGITTPPVRKPRLPHDPPVITRADITEARSLGWEPKISLEDGIRSMVPYIKAELEAGRISGGRT